MFAVREILRNPLILVYHVSIELTRTVVEGYATGIGRTSSPLVAAILGIPGVRGLQFFRYEL